MIICINECSLEIIQDRFIDSCLITKEERKVVQFRFKTGIPLKISGFSLLRLFGYYFWTFERPVTECCAIKGLRKTSVWKEKKNWESGQVSGHVARDGAQSPDQHLRVTGRPQINWSFFEVKMNTFWGRTSRDFYAGYKRIQGMPNTFFFVGGSVSEDVQLVTLPCRNNEPYSAVCTPCSEAELFVA